MRCLSAALIRHIPIIATQFTHNPKSFFSSLIDATAITDALNLAGNSRSLILGTQIHSHIIKLGLSKDVYTRNNTIKMYQTCGEFGNARKVFDEMSERNLVSWTLIISGANKNSEYEVGMKLFVDMIRIGCFAVNEFALGSVTKACVGIGAVEFGLCVHCFAVKIGLEGNVFVGSSVLHMYHAWKLFQTMEFKDIASWNTILAVCSQGTNVEQVVTLLNEFMAMGLKPNRITFSILFRMCGDVVKLELGQQLVLN